VPACLAFEFDVIALGYARTPFSFSDFSNISSSPEKLGSRKLIFQPAGGWHMNHDATNDTIPGTSFYIPAVISCER
jgi:hypothetical protein